MRREQTLDTANMPTSSWWLGLDRDGLKQKASDELARMRRSRFGSVDSVTLGPQEPKKEKVREPL